MYVIMIAERQPREKDRRTKTMTKDELKNRIIEAIEDYDQPVEITGLTVKEMRELLGLNKAKFCRKYDIPPRTLDSWESGERQPAPYLQKLLERAVREDKKRA